MGSLSINKELYSPAHKHEPLITVWADGLPNFNYVEKVFELPNQDNIFPNQDNIFNLTESGFTYSSQM
jgi:hypothetical protein